MISTSYSADWIKHRQAWIIKNQIRIGPLELTRKSDSYGWVLPLLTGAVSSIQSN